jgi:hypothetical protein
LLVQVDEIAQVVQGHLVRLHFFLPDPGSSGAGEWVVSGAGKNRGNEVGASARQDGEQEEDGRSARGQTARKFDPKVEWEKETT